MDSSFGRGIAESVGISLLLGGCVVLLVGAGIGAFVMWLVLR